MNLYVIEMRKLLDFNAFEAIILNIDKKWRNLNMTLDKLEIGKKGVIAKVGGERSLRLRLLDMGLIPKTEVSVYKIAPLGDPIEIVLRGYMLTIRKEDAANIELAETGADVV